MSRATTKSEKRLTQHDRRNLVAKEIQEGKSRRAKEYRDTRPLQGVLHRTTRCVVCYEWVETNSYNPARCEGCAEGGRLF